MAESKKVRQLQTLAKSQMPQSKSVTYTTQTGTFYSDFQVGGRGVHVLKLVG